jgi:peptide/nickel transport system substrate-binding protein
MKLRSISIGLLIVFNLTGLSACSIGSLPWQEPATQTAALSVTSVPTPVPEKELTICLGEEPESLYLYASQQSEAMWSILEAVYDGPIDRTNGSYTPVLLQKIPTYEDGDLTRTAVAVTEGILVVDSSNHVVALETGVSILPAGCSDSSCAIAWDGVSEIQMDQVMAIYKLRSNLLWSDGISLTSADSRFSFEVDSDPATAGGDKKIELTASYEVVDDLTVQWKGIPGFQGIDSLGMFWVPLPEHLLGSLPISELAATDLATRQPMGWGPYVITEWMIGKYISLQKNSNYFRANEGLPKFDRVIFRFVDPDSGGSLAALASGQCDLIDRSSDPQSDLLLVTDLLDSTETQAEWTIGPEIIQLVLGVKPANYDGGYNAASDRLDFLGNTATRQAVAACIDQQALNDMVFMGKAGLASIADLLGNQSGGAGTALTVFDPVIAGKLFDQAGWVDDDNDQATPRLALNVLGVPAGTPLMLELLTPSDTISLAIASGIAEALTGCGVDVNITNLPFSELYAPGPDGLVFGRAFDMVLINWQYNLVPACYLYTTVQIPTAGNYWIGGNVAGYSNDGFDVACSGLMLALPGDGEYEQYLQKAVEYFSTDLPAIPLLKLPRLVITRPDFCAIKYDPFARSDLTDLELFDFGLACSSQ